MRSLNLFFTGCITSLLLLGNVRAAEPFPLMAWDYVDDEKTLKLMSECGVNLVGFVRPQMLDACKKYKLKALVFDESIASEDYAIPFDAKLADNLPALIKKVNKHP